MKDRMKLQRILAAVLLSAIALAGYLEEVLFRDTFQPLVDVFPAFITNWDIPIFISINSGLANTYVGWAFNILTRLGSTIFMLTICVALYSVRRRRESLIIFWSIIVGTLLTLPLKLAVPRPRPSMILPSTVLFDREPGSSFPSGHSMRIFAFASVGSRLWPRLTIPLHVLALLVAFSRIYMGQHFPSDVIAGTAIGLVAGYLTTKYQNQLLRMLSHIGLTA